jgi:hypothetical protein
MPRPDQPRPALHASDEQRIDQDEVDGVLAALRRLRDRVQSPVIRACLEAARADIAHLATSDRTVEDFDAREEQDGAATDGRLLAA